MPPNTWKQVLAADPELANVVRNITGFLESESGGSLSNATLRTMQNQAAVYGHKMGLPLTDFSGHQGLAKLGIDVEKHQQQGVTDTSNFMALMAKMMDDPALAAQLAAWNATNSAAPDPAAAYRQMMQDYRSGMQGGFGGARGGGGGYSPAGGTVRNYNTPEFGGGQFVYGSLATDSPTAGTVDRTQDWLNTLKTDEEIAQDLYDAGLIGDPSMFFNAGGGVAFQDPEFPWQV